MRCKKHLSDFSSRIGVCASCLRERLILLIQAQSQARAQQAQAQVQAQAQAHSRAVHHQPLPLPDVVDRLNHQHQLVFPRSVSPYISRRKSDTSSAAVDESPLHHRLFFSTPQLGPTRSSYTTTANDDAAAAATGRKSINNNNKKNNKWIKLAVISDLFRFRSRSKTRSSASDPAAVSSSSSQPPPPSSDASSSWKPGKSSKSITRMFSYDETTAASRRERRQVLYTARDRGMSPDDAERYDEGGGGGGESESEFKRRNYYNTTNSNSFVVEESPQRPGVGLWRTQTTSSTNGRFRASPARSSVSNAWGICLSPLVRATPINRPWNAAGGAAAEAGYSAEILRKGTPPHLHTHHPTTPLSTNRSRKIANFGRFNHNR